MGKTRTSIIKKADELLNISRIYTPVNDERWNISKEILNQELTRSKRKGVYLDLRGLAYILFEAGRIYGIRQERNKKYNHNN